MALKQVEDNYNARKRASLGVPKTSRNWNHNKFLESLYGKSVEIWEGDDVTRGELICHDSFTLLVRIHDGREQLVFKGAGMTIVESPCQ